MSDPGRLIDDYLDGELTPEDEKKLVEWLSSDPEHVRTFVKVTHAHRYLREIMLSPGAGAPLREESEARPGRRHLSPRHPSAAPLGLPLPWFVGAAAAVLVVVAAAIMSRPQGGAPVGPTAAHESAPGPVEVERPVEPAQAPRIVDRRQPPEEIREPGAVKEPGLELPTARVQLKERPPAPLVVPPETPSPAPSRPTVALVAEIMGLSGDAFVLKDGGREPARSGRGLLPGWGLEIGGGDAAASLRLPDGTRLALGADTVVRRISEGRGGGKIIAIETGTVDLEAAAQLAGRWLTLLSPHAEVRVIGTLLRLSVSRESTCLEVREGRVRLTRLADGASIDVTAGRFTTAAPGAPLVSRPLPLTVLTRAFQDGVSPAASYEGTRDTTISDGAPTVNYGADKTVRADGSDKRARLAALIRWDLSDVPPGSRVLSAEVELYVVNACNGRPYRFHGLRGPWDEREATWRTRDGKNNWQIPGAKGSMDRGGAVLATLAPFEKGEHVVLLNEAGRQAVQAWINNPSVNHGFVVDGANPDGVDFSSREVAAPSQRPRLRVTYVPTERR